jgi:hypothetical protein
MAPVLQCPDCGEKHPLATVPTSGAFPCRGCGRVLKVPESGTRPPSSPPDAVTTAAAAPAPATVRTPVPVATAVARPTAADPNPADPDVTRVVPPVDGQALGALSPKSLRPATHLGSVPWWLRLLLWVVAVPVSFLLVFVIARGLSVFTTNQLSDLFLANDNARFWPVARLLPFVALLTATIVQVGVFLLARARGRKAGARPIGDLSGSASPRRAR